LSVWRKRGRFLTFSTFDMQESREERCRSSQGGRSGRSRDQIHESTKRLSLYSRTFCCVHSRNRGNHSQKECAFLQSREKIKISEKFENFVKIKLKILSYVVMRYRAPCLEMSSWHFWRTVSCTCCNIHLFVSNKSTNWWLPWHLW
jgi:hypothetical protein